MNIVVTLSALEVYVLISRLTELTDRIEAESDEIKHSEKTVELINKAIVHYNSRWFRIFKFKPDETTTTDMSMYSHVIPNSVLRNGPSYASTTVLLYHWFEPNSDVTIRLSEIAKVYYDIKYLLDHIKYTNRLKYPNSTVTIDIWDYTRMNKALESNLYGGQNEKEES